MSELNPLSLPSSCYYTASPPTLHIVDQRILPHEFKILQFTQLNDIINAIKNMTVRGAPAIGAVASYCIAIVSKQNLHLNRDEFLTLLRNTKVSLDASRPTAVNLMWATSRILSLAEILYNHDKTNEYISEALVSEAISLADDDILLNKRIGEIGNTVVPMNANILTHCNTGTLATVSYGTAIGIIYTAHSTGKNVHVWVDETRPRLQGTKLTSWELNKAGVPLHLIVDSAAGILMYQKKVDIVLFGADRVTSNGDVANKIGTLKVSVCAHEFGIPVFAVVPTSTIDLECDRIEDIIIEERDSTEVTHVNDVQLAPDNIPVYNPAFDVTPAKYISGIITEEGICYPPFNVSLRKAKEAAEMRIRDVWNQRVSNYNK